MTKLLVAPGKYSTLHFDITTKEQEQKAWLALFNFNDKKMHYYTTTSDEEEEEEMLVAARAGNWKAAKWLLDLRHDYEYEKWTIHHCVSDKYMDEWIDSPGVGPPI